MERLAVACRCRQAPIFAGLSAMPLPAPLRCHLLIGPPASGKTTLASVLAQLTSAVVLSTDVVRQELFGDAAVQGPWRDIETLLHQRLRDSVAAGIPVILGATHARRPWRLAITQALSLPAPVEWIGWWLYTPLATCLQWNQTRKRLVPEPVIREMAAWWLPTPGRCTGVCAAVHPAAPSAAASATAMPSAPPCCRPTGCGRSMGW